MSCQSEAAAVERSVSFILMPDCLGNANIHPLFEESQRPVTSWSRGFPPTSGQRFSASLSAHRLMGRPGVDTKRPKAAQLWGVHRGGRDSALDIGQTEYITRLTALRDSLIDQEQMYLAQALDRLRIHSLSNKSSSYRLRMNGDDVSKSSSPTGHAQTPRTNMVTTVEKFRQMRPKRQQPVIFPLQGRQLLENQQQKDRDTASSDGGQQRAGNSTSRSVKDTEMIARSLPSKVDETVQANLQRLLQPTSSIPNIGRKALKKQQSFEPKTRALLNGNNNSNSSSGNRFITRPRVIVPKRSPPQPSPDTIIEAVTNSNLIYSMNNNHHHHLYDGSSTNSGSNSNNNNFNNVHYNSVMRNSANYEDAAGSETDSIKSGGGGGYGVRQNVSNNINHHNGGNNNRKVNKRISKFSDDRESFPYLNTRDCEPYPLPNNFNNSTIYIPGSDDISEGHELMDTDTEYDVKDALQRKEGKRGQHSINSNSLSMGRKLYGANVGPSEQNKSSFSRLPPWQNRNHHGSDNRTRTHANHSNSVNDSRSNSQLGSTAANIGPNNSNSTEVRNSIDIYLPSTNPFGTPFVRENTSGSESGWFRMTPYNPSAESIQPGTRFPTINVNNETEEQQVKQQATTTTSEDRRSRSSSRGEVALPARTHNTSSLPNVRSRYMAHRKRSNSSGEGFPEEPGTKRDPHRPWMRVSHSQGGRRRVDVKEGDEEREEDEDTEDPLNSSSKRHIVIDMPSIIFNAASPDVAVENSNLTPASWEVNQVQGQGSTPHSRAGGHSSSSTAATPTGWSPASGGGAPAVPNLSKAVKQQEIRKRELQNLLEDVRELNIRTEVLSSQPEVGEVGSHLEK